MRTLVALVLCIGLSLAAGGIGAIASASAGEFYSQLTRPSWAPPGWLFGPVWTALYLMMGAAAFLVWRERGWDGARTVLLFFAAHLVLNALWSWLFFRWRLGAGSFIEIVVLWLTIVALVVAFARIRTSAALLMLPYLAWVTFASVLNFTLWQRNTHLLR